MNDTLVRDRGDGSTPVSSAFVTMDGLYRALVLGAAVLYVLSILGVNLLHPSDAIGWPVLAVTAMVALYMVPILFYRESWGWFHPLVFGSIVAFIPLLRRWAVYAAGLSHHVGLPSYSGAELDTLVGYEAALGCLALLAYYFAYFFLPVPRSPVLRYRRPPKTRITRRMLFVAVAAMILFVIFVQQRGGLISHMMTWAIGRRTALSGQYYWLQGVSFGPLACLIWMAARPRAVRDWRFMSIFGVLIAATFLGNASRSTVIFYFMAALGVWMLRRGRVSFTRPLVLAVLSLFLVGALGILRQSTWGGGGTLDLSSFTTGGVGTALSSAVEEMALRSGEDRALYVILAKVPEEIDHIHGSSYLSFFTTPIPRAVWPDKPFIIQAQVGEVFYGRAFGMPPGAIGEAYWNFSVPGVIVAFLLFGIFHRWLANTYRANEKNGVTVPLYMVTLLMLSSPYTAAALSWLQLMVPLLILMVFAGFWSPLGALLGRSRPLRGDAADGVYRT